MRIIKKYPNRRLYDTESSKYITLARVAELVRDKEEFQVIESGTKKDITRSVLLQIIVEQESSDEALFSSDSLSQLISYYGNTVPSLFNGYLQGSLRGFADEQQKLCKQFNAESMNLFTQMAQDNLERWQTVQKNFIDMSGFSYGSTKQPEDDKK